jgi:hypothetical protein
MSIHVVNNIRVLYDGGGVVAQYSASNVFLCYLYVTFGLIYDLKARIFKIPHGVDIHCS